MLHAKYNVCNNYYCLEQWSTFSFLRSVNSYRLVVGQSNFHSCYSIFTSRSSNHSQLLPWARPVVHHYSFVLFYLLDGSCVATDNWQFWIIWNLHHIFTFKTDNNYINLKHLKTSIVIWRLIARTWMHFKMYPLSYVSSWYGPSSGY